MTEGQAYLFKLLKEIITICNENNIRYYLAGGTLIGAVRHRGFLPWDDDIDLYMTRDEFLKFVDVAQKGGLPENRMLECQELNREYHNVFARYTDISTSSIHKPQIATNDVAGQVIDILQLDPIPRNERIQKKHFKRLLLYSDLINTAFSYSHRLECNKYSYRFHLFLTKIIGKDRVLSALEKRMFSYPEEECSQYFMRWGCAALVFEKDLFEPALEAEFEGIRMTIPYQYSQYLIDHYGDEWMYIPHVSGQSAHEAVHSLCHDYNTIRNSYLEIIDVKKLFREYTKRKINMMSSARSVHIVADRIVYLRGVRLKEELLLEIKKKNYNLKEMYQAGNYKTLEKLFNKYYTLQNSAQFSGRDTYKDFYRYQKPICIDLPPDIFWVALITLIDIGKFGKAYRMIQIYEKTNKDLPADLKNLKELIEKQRRAANCISIGDFKQGLKISEELLNVLPNNSRIMKLCLQCLFKESPNEENKIKSLIKKGEKLYPKDGDFLKYEADLKYRYDQNEACVLYLKAKSMTTNGLVLLEIDDQIKEYKNQLVQKMHQSFWAGDYNKADQIYNRIQIVDDTPEMECVYLSSRLHENTTREEAFQYYVRAKALIPDVEGEVLTPILEKILAFCGETPMVSSVHIKMLQTALNCDNYSEIEKELNRKKEIAVNCHLDTVYIELKKLEGDLLISEGKKYAAYNIYRQIFHQLQEESLAKKELIQFFEKEQHLAANSFVS